MLAPGTNGARPDGTEKKGEKTVAVLEAAGFQVVEDQEAFDRLLVFDPTVP